MQIAVTVGKILLASLFLSIPAFAKPSDPIPVEKPKVAPPPPQCPAGTTTVPSVSGPTQTKVCYPNYGDDCTKFGDDACAAAKGALTLVEAGRMKCGKGKEGSCSILGEPKLDGPTKGEPAPGSKGIPYSCKATATLCCTCIKEVVEPEEKASVLEKNTY